MPYLQRDPRNPVSWPVPVTIPDGLDESDAPEALCCPITCALMREPCLVTKTGNTFERSAIIRWIEDKGTSPIDRTLHLTLNDLAPNRALRAMVEDWIEQRRNLAATTNSTARANLQDHPRAAAITALAGQARAPSHEARRERLPPPIWPISSSADASRPGPSSSRGTSSLANDATEHLRLLTLASGGDAAPSAPHPASPSSYPSYGLTLD